MRTIFDLEEVRSAIRAGRLRWRAHALERLLERHIGRGHVLWTLFHGEVIEEYPSSRPYPAALVWGKPEGKVLHVVVAYATQSKEAYVISAYEPNKDRFEEDFRARRQTKKDE